MKRLSSHTQYMSSETSISLLITCCRFGPPSPTNNLPGDTERKKILHDVSRDFTHPTVGYLLYTGYSNSYGLTLHQLTLNSV
jgi:hypothetical protein